MPIKISAGCNCEDCFPFSEDAKFLDFLNHWGIIDSDGRGWQIRSRGWKK